MSSHWERPLPPDIFNNLNLIVDKLILKWYVIGIIEVPLITFNDHLHKQEAQLSLHMTYAPSGIATFYGNMIVTTLPMDIPDAKIFGSLVFCCVLWLKRYLIAVVAKWYMLQKKCLKKWIGSALLGTTRCYNFQPPTLTLSATMHIITERRQYHVKSWSYCVQQYHQLIH